MLTTDKRRYGKHKLVVSGRKILGNMHARENIEMGWQRMCNIIDILCMVET